MQSSDYHLKEAKLFNGRESFILIESLRSEREHSIESLDKLEEEAKETGKRPIFTKEFIKQEFNQLIEKIEENTKTWD
tara:strand:+ start:695 stop:928 length:234 start_codon:yes stop_codon:yes gene_type:complete